MKKLLGVTVLLALFFALVPVHASAALRGVWDPLTNGAPFNTGLANGCEQPSLRNANIRANGGHAQTERWYSFSTRSTVVGSETVRSIWLGQNAAQIGFSVADIMDARRPMLLDPAAMVSYTDPAWSPNGKYLAYVQTDGQITQSAIYVQEYMTGTTTLAATTPVGSPLLVVPAAPGVINRTPDWKPDGTALCYASNAAGPSTDIWYVSVDVPTATVGVPARATTNDARSEINPTWGPNNLIAYATNKFGRNVIEIADLNAPGTFYLAETNFASISHNNPSWSSDGASIFYDAPQGEDINNNTDIFKLDLATQSKCDIFFDNRGDADPDVSSLTNFNLDGNPYNLFLCSSQGANFGLGIWRASANNCFPALPLGVAISPTTLNLGSNGGNLNVTISMPAETQAAGFVAVADVDDKGFIGIPAGHEGIKNRNSIIISPTFLGQPGPTSAVNGAPFAAMTNQVNGGEYETIMQLNRKTVEARLVALGLVNQTVICPVTAYSSTRGRQFQGYGYLKLSSNNAAGQVVRLEQNSPNPFNPVTKIRFSVAKPGFVNVRVYNVRGELVKTVASGNYGTGSHEAAWDGSTSTGAKAASGIYFAKASVGDGKGSEITSDVVKMVMAK
ncbi:MAG TPA: FlgD immunoglobulin-like domain containing protein [Candidatus Eisenbacteria bacterium]|nr:FlgD immunoglobulin-like domain containing protein [Candidatus Eisenbacteria bacterium]